MLTTGSIFDQIKSCEKPEEVALILEGHYIHSYEAWIRFLNREAYTETELMSKYNTKD